MIPDFLFPYHKKEVQELNEITSQISAGNYPYELLDMFLTGLSLKIYEKKPKSNKRKRKQFNRKEFLEVLKKSNYKCMHCGCDENLAIDHIQPWSKGGSDDIDNLQILCTSCNNKKRNKY